MLQIQNGATFVIIDKISNTRDGGPALLIQGMLLIFKHYSIALLSLWTWPVLVRLILLLVSGNCMGSKLDTSYQMMEVGWIRRPFVAVWVLGFQIRNLNQPSDDVCSIRSSSNLQFLSFRWFGWLLAFQMVMDSKPAPWDLELTL